MRASFRRALRGRTRMDCQPVKSVDALYAVLVLTPHSQDGHAEHISRFDAMSNQTEKIRTHTNTDNLLYITEQRLCGEHTRSRCIKVIPTRFTDGPRVLVSALLCSVLYPFEMTWWKTLRPSV